MRYSLLKQMLSIQSPQDLLKSWFKEACEKADNPETQGTAMTVSTVDPEGSPSARVVLLKSFTENGFVFFTNYDSKKGRDLATNPRVSVNFHWPHLGRQVHVFGTAAKTSRKVSENYWNSRPRESQISQCISKQSRPLAESTSLEELYNSYANQWANQPIPCPENWGGYEVTPTSYQFWVAQPNRLHQRVESTWENNQWNTYELYP